MIPKNILVLIKRSTYQYYFLDDRGHERYQNSHVTPLIKKRFWQAHQAHHSCVREIKSVLKTSKLKYEIFYRGQQIDYRSFDLIITVGGDGTFLEAARQIKKQAILGVNSDPSRSIGRFCIADASNFKNVVESIIHGRFKINLVQRICLRVGTSSKKVNVLNDLLICHLNPASMSRYSLMIAGREDEHRSSGLWIATAAGSTGAIHSAGGKLLDPQSSKVQYMPRELFQRNKIPYRFKGGIVSLQKTMIVQSQMKNGMIYVDGAHLCIPFSFGKRAAITLSTEPLKIISIGQRRLR